MTAAGPPAESVTRLPDGFGLVLDAGARRLRRDLWFGGSPARVVRLSERGQCILQRLLDGGVVDSEDAGRLARRVTDAGLAHPVPPAPAPDALDVTVVIPVHDRADLLDRCLAALGRRFPVVVVDDASIDGTAVALVAEAHGARYRRRRVNGGPGAARNDGLALVDTPLVAFVDSDTVPTGDWIDPLAAHLADPVLAAVAPRVTPAPGGGSGWWSRYNEGRSSLDLGDAPGLVTPLGRVGYVPSAALVARTSAVRDVGGFDVRLRVGEDVDLMWRWLDAGWRVRYEPAVAVAHVEPGNARELLTRRFRYGTSAGELAVRHPARIAPLVLRPGPTSTVVALAAGRPGWAAATFVGAVLSVRRELARADVPTAGVVGACGRAVTATWSGVGRYLVQFWWPVLVAVAVRAPVRRRAAIGLLTIGATLPAAWTQRRRIDPLRFVAAQLADDMAYGAGVWVGALQARTSTPLRPVVPISARTKIAVRRAISFWHSMS